MSASIWQPGVFVPPLPFFFINVMTEGAVGDGVTDDTAAFNSAFSKGTFVYAPPGNYLLGNVVLPAGAYFFGAGPANTRLIQAPNPVGGKGILFANSGSASSFLDGIVLRDFSVVGRSLLDPFNEFYHLISLNGVRNFLVTNVHFYSYQGDGLYIGSGDSAGQERHNFNGVVMGCYFDGVNYENRNAISVIDCDGLDISHNTFYRSTRSNMPGAVDIEPDQTWHIVKNISVHHNTFRQVGGNVGVVACVMAGNIPAPLNINVSHNRFEDSVTTTPHGEITVSTNRLLTEADPHMNITIAYNTGNNGSKPFELRAIKGCVVSHNLFDVYASNSLIGFTSSTDTVMGCKVDSNRFRRVGTGIGSNYGIAIFNVNDLTLESNTFDDCGDGSAGSTCLDFAQGGSTRVKLLNNVYRSPTGRSLSAIVKEPGHTFSPLTNTQMDDTFLNALANNFQALETNNGWQTYLPIVAGATTAGAPSAYNVQQGYWRREGNVIFFMINLEWAVHSGTGIMRISLPARAAARPLNPLIPVGSVSHGTWAGGGIPPTNSQFIANLNDQAIVNGVQGCIQMARTDGVTIVGLPIVVTGSLQIRGMYEANIDVMV